MYDPKSLHNVSNKNILRSPGIHFTFFFKKSLSPSGFENNVIPSSEARAAMLVLLVAKIY
jgi:hypothetical protein